MQVEFSRLPTDKIQTQNWSLHSFIKDPLPEKLHSSLKLTGLLHPPIVISQADGYYLLIAGHRRFHWLAHESQQKSITALVLPSSLSLVEQLNYLLRDQLTNGELTSMEKCYFLHICRKFISDDAIRSSFLPSLALKGSTEQIDNQLRLLQLEPILQEGLHEKTITDKMAFQLLSMDSSERLHIYSLFTKLQLGNGKQKRLLNLSRDLAGRQSKKLDKILEEAKISEILEHREMNIPQKANTLLEHLQQSCFAKSSAAEKTFKKDVQGLKLPKTCHLEHSPSFEQDNVTLHLSFQNLAKCKKGLADILKGIKKAERD